MYFLKIDRISTLVSKITITSLYLDDQFRRRKMLRRTSPPSPKRVIMGAMIYVILSAFLYVLATMFPVTSCFAMTTFLIPLCLLKPSNHWRSRLSYGFLWGMIVFTVYFWWLFVLFYTKYGNLWCCILSLCMIIWCSSLAGLWFVFFPFARLWSTVIFFIIISKYCFCLSGVVEGYSLCSPLVVLASYPWMLDCLYGLSDAGMLALLFAAQISCADALQAKKENCSKVIFVGCMIIFIVGHLSNPQLQTLQTSKMITLCPWWYGCGDPMFAGYRMSHDLSVVMQKYPETKLIVMPESTYCWDLQEYRSFMEIWSDSAGDAQILFGAHEADNSADNGTSHNVVFLLHNNTLLFRYRKQHFMPLIERSIWIERWCNKSLIGQVVQTNATDVYDDDLVTINGVMYQIFICSEFFFESKKVKGHPVILLWNDSWLCLDWVKRLALLFIVYFEKKYRVPILHVSTQGVSNI